MTRPAHLRFSLDPRRWTLGVVGLVCAQACLACSGPEWPGVETDAPEAPAPDVDADPVTEVEITGAVAEPGDHPVDGLTVCAVGEVGVPCATTDHKGKFSMRVPAASRLMLSLEGRDDFPPAVLTYETTREDSSFRVLTIPLALLPLLDDAIGQEIDLSLGHILLEARSEPVEPAPNVAGVSAKIDPARGLGPFYQADLLPDPELTETGAAGGIGFVNLPSGTYQVALHHQVRTCGPWVAWPSDQPETIVVEAIEGYVTLASVICD